MKRVALIATVLLLLVSCSKTDEYRIGVFVPLSGSAAEKGVPFKNAMELYANEVNASGGIAGHPLKLVFKDDANDPAKAKAAASELVQDPAVLAVIGTYYAEAAQGAVKVFEENKTVCLFPTIGDSDIINANKYMFTLNSLDDEQGGFIAVYLKEVMKKDNVLVIHNPDPFGTGLKDAFRADVTGPFGR